MLVSRESMQRGVIIGASVPKSSSGVAVLEEATSELSVAPDLELFHGRSASTLLCVKTLLCM